MNFLAHIYLSGDSEDLLIGNFIADFVGNKYTFYKPEIVAGIKLHHRIDDFTDNHDVVSRSKKLFHSKYHKYSGVIIDLVYDHLLAKNWSKYSSVPLEKYSNEFYKTINGRMEEMPEGVKFMLPYMAKDNWLYNYRTYGGLHRALSGLARRTSFVSNMEHAIADIEANIEALQEDFDLFFPELMIVCEKFKNALQ